MLHQVCDPRRNRSLKLSSERLGVRDQLLAAGRTARRLQQSKSFSRQHLRLAGCNSANHFSVCVVVREWDSALKLAGSSDVAEAMPNTIGGPAVPRNDFFQYCSLGLSDGARCPAKHSQFAAAFPHPGCVECVCQIHDGTSDSAGVEPMTRYAAEVKFSRVSGAIQHSSSPRA